MIKREKPIIGQTLYSLNIGNSARRKKQILTKGKVVKVGRKYFSVDFGYYKPSQYYLCDWGEKTDYSPDSELYEKPQDLEDKKEEQLICKEIWSAFEYGRNRNGLSLGTLRKIRRFIIEE